MIVGVLRAAQLHAFRVVDPQTGLAVQNFEFDGDKAVGVFS
jgi:hypothetical protein